MGRPFRWFLVVCCFVTTTSTVGLVAEGHGARQEGESVNGLRLALTTNRSVYSPGDTVVFTLHWVNVSDHSMKCSYMEPNLTFSLFFARDDGAPVLSTSVSIHDFGRYVEFKMKPSETYSSKVTGKLSWEEVKGLSFPLDQAKRMLVLRFDEPSEVGALALGGPGNFRVTFGHRQVARPWFDRRGWGAWSGEARSRPVLIEVREDRKIHGPPLKSSP